MAIAFNIFNILLKGNIFKLETLFVYILAPFGGSAGAVFLFFIYQYLVEKKNAKWIIIVKKYMEQENISILNNE